MANFLTRGAGRGAGKGSRGGPQWARWLSPRMIILGWTGFAVFLTAAMGVFTHLSGQPFSWLGSLLANLLCSWLWALATPLIAWLAHRFPLDRSSRFRNFCLHALIGVAVVTGLLVIFNVVTMLVTEGGSLAYARWREKQLNLLRWFFTSEIVYYWVVVLGQHAHGFLQQAQARAAEAAGVREQLAKARLAALTAQLQPHFLFNTLHTIAGLVRLDQRDKALDTLSEFGELMRYSLDCQDDPLTPLLDEAAFVQTYLTVVGRRFGDRLHWRINVPEACERALVPALVLQPLVENAVHHGLGEETGRLELEVAAKRIDGRLRLTVADDGPGFPPGWQMGQGEGIGLSNTAERLQQFFGEAQSFQAGNRPGGGALVALELPFRAAEEGNHAPTD